MVDFGIGGRTAIITGGSHGLGRATAAALAHEGVKVAICGRNADTLERSAAQIREETGGDVFSYVADVTDVDAVERFVAATTSRFGPVDIFISNADSATRQANFFDLTDDDWIEKFTVKLLAPIRFVRLLAPSMMERGWGRIVAMSGATTRLIYDYGMPKGAAQAGLINMIAKLANSLGQYGITANVVEPGHLWTDGPTVEGRSRQEIRRAEVEQAAASRGLTFEEMDAEMKAALVLGRRIDPEESARVILFIVSQLASTITGQVIMADGGESRYVRY